MPKWSLSRPLPLSYTTIRKQDVNERAPLIYQIDVVTDGHTETYIGQSVLGSQRARVTHLRMATIALIGGRERCQKIHYAMAEAIRRGGTLRLTLLENALLETLTDRERHYVSKTGASLNAMLPSGGGKKTDRLTPKRAAALRDVISATSWKRWRSENGQRWGAASHAYKTIHHLASKAEGERELIRALVERNPCTYT